MGPTRDGRDRPNGVRAHRIFRVVQRRASQVDAHHDLFDSEPSEQVRLRRSQDSKTRRQVLQTTLPKSGHFKHDHQLL